MSRELRTIEAIQNEKQKEANATQLPPIDSEVKELAAGKRFTFDVVTVPVDPLR